MASPNIRFIIVLVSFVITLLRLGSIDKLYVRVDQARMTGDALKFDPNDPTNSLILFENIDLTLYYRVGRLVKSDYYLHFLYHSELIEFSPQDLESPHSEQTWSHSQKHSIA